MIISIHENIIIRIELWKKCVNKRRRVLTLPMIVHGLIIVLCENRRKKHMSHNENSHVLFDEQNRGLGGCKNMTLLQKKMKSKLV